MFEKIKKNINFNSILIIICVIVLFLIVYNYSTLFITDLLPDEISRARLPYFLYQFNYLPIGNEPQIVDPAWGFSYALFPYLTSLIACVFMKIAGIFNGDLLVAMRLVSVLSVCGTFVMAALIGKDLFKKNSSTVLFAVLCGFLPQFIFIGTYFNNDAFSVFISSVIIFCWIKGIKNNWSYKICILLGVALGCLALTYYNAYAFILLSIPVYFITYYNNNKGDWKGLFIKALLIFAIAFLIAGWFFIRNYFLWNGDFLGLKTRNILCEQNAELYKSINRHIPALQNQSFSEAFLNFNGELIENWFVCSAISYVGVFGYMNILLDMNFYLFYFGLFIIGFLSFIVFKLKNIKKFAVKNIFNNKNVIIIAFILCMIIPLVLSLSYSYYTDYQPQGRYLISSLVPFMAFITWGYEELLSKISKKLDLNYVVIFSYLAVCFIIISRYFCYIPFR